MPIPILVVILIFCPSGHASPPESPSPIKIITNNWSSQIVLSHVTGSLFGKMGYQVEYVDAETWDQWGKLRFGLAHVQVEVWEGTMGEMFNRFVQHGGLLDAGTHDARTREDWWYPAYVEKQCPGLPDWQALQKCAELFATPLTTPQGMYLSGPWEKPDLARIRALELNFKPVQVMNAEELWAALKDAVKKQKPIVLFNWTPNWVEAKYEGRFVEFPKYEPECESDPTWGINHTFLHDCGNPSDGWLKKAAWKDMEATWPCAFMMLNNINFDNRMLSQLAAWVDADQMSHEAAAQKWIQNNKSTWSQWIPEACRG